MIPQRTESDLAELLKDPRIENWEGDTNWPIRSHSAKGPLFIHFPTKIYIAMDKKDDGYPNLQARGKACGFGGNWNDVRQKCPEDLYRMEIMEELIIKGNDAENTPVHHPLADMMREGVVRYHCFGEYFGVMPREVHGNKKIGLYLNPMTWFVADVRGTDLLDRLGVPREGITPEKLHKAITEVTEFKCSALFDIDDIKAGKHSSESMFAFGDDRMLADVLKAEYNIDPGFVNWPMDLYRLSDVRLNEPYSTRWTAQHDFLNPIRKGTTRDAYVFDADGRKQEK